MRVLKIQTVSILILLKTTLGTNQKTSSLDWNDEIIKILKNDFKHIKIKLDRYVNGKVQL